jgi:anti-sigma B factor antagonist
LVNLYLNQSRVGEVTVVDLKGRNRIGAGIELHRALRCLVDEGKQMILLNLAGVTHVDSAGLGEMIASSITIRNRGGVLKVVHLNERLQEVMSLANILSVFEVYDDEATAVASFTEEKSTAPSTLLRMEKTV